MQLRSLEAAFEQKYFQNCIRAYFEKEPGCDLRWIVGVIGRAKAHARLIIEKRFSQYAGTPEYDDLIALLHS